ncbi:MAG: branched-chain amino acid ABC transporter permease [Acidimicrobiia bacterium]|nr:branched-chain amino acid ABC transporter permease [Acidimicrobiia bacterium]
MFGVQAVYFALAAIGLNVHFGYTGLLNFGQAGFMAVGAYGVGISVATYDLPFGIAVIIGLLSSVVFALILGIPTLRLRADYLAIVTIAAAEIIRIMFRATTWRDITGGSNGINDFSDGFYSLNPYDGRVSFGFLDYSPRQMWVITVGWTLVLLSVGFVYLVIHSPWGRALKAVRDDEDAARALGKNAYSIKMQSLILGGLFGALGGIIFALGQASIQPSPQDYGTAKTFFIWVALILGGTGSLWGPVIGSMMFSGLLAFTDSALRDAERADNIPEWLMQGVQVGQIRFILMGLGLMLLMIFRPQGIFGNKRELALDAQ